MNDILHTKQAKSIYKDNENQLCRRKRKTALKAVLLRKVSFSFNKLNEFVFSRFSAGNEDDGRQRVVEVVRRARGQLADGGETLGVDQPLLHLLELAEVARDRERLGERALLVPQGDGADLHGNAGAVLAMNRLSTRLEPVFLTSRKPRSTASRISGG